MTVFVNAAIQFCGRCCRKLNFVVICLQVASAAAGDNGWAWKQDDGVCGDQATSWWSGLQTETSWVQTDSVLWLIETNCCLD